MSIITSKTKTHCFAYNELLKDCNCLTKLECSKGPCAFYKHENDVDLRAISEAIRNYAGMHEGEK